MNVTGEERIAVIGMAGRFPDAPDVATLWRNLLAGVVAIRRPDRAGADPRPADPEGNGPHGQRRAHGMGGRPDQASAVLTDVDRFDAAFFGVGRDEAEIMDPQHRIFLECCWAALEDAGYSPAACPGLVGVFAGCAFPGYLLSNVMLRPELVRKHGRVRVALANDHDALTARVSQKLDLRGPSVTVQTFSSTSLVAVHLARQSLLGRECDVALAGAAAVKCPQVQAYEGMTSPDGECRSFDAAASGSVIGNAVAVVVLKRLADAERDNDHITAVLSGSAVNSDGRRSQLSTPTLAGKAGVIAEALANAGVGPQDIGYVEGQGIGTLVGDSLEITALVRAFRTRPQRADPCLLGSITANIGHVEGTSGICGLIKVALMVRSGVVPPQPGFTEPNPALADTNLFRVAVTTGHWPHGSKRRAGVSSFGIGGVNAHVIVEEPPVPGQSLGADIWPDGPSLLVVSARTTAALEAATARLCDALADKRYDLADVAFTLQTGRTAFPQRRTLVCADQADAWAALSDPGLPRVLTGCAPRRTGVVLLVPRDPWDCAAVAADLYRHSPLFRTVIGQAAVAARVPCQALLDLPGALQAELAADWPTVVRYALGRVLMGLVPSPTAVAGTGRGAIVADCLADRLPTGVFMARLAASGRAAQADQQEARRQHATALLADETCLGVVVGTHAHIPWWPAESCTGRLRSAASGREQPGGEAIADLADLAAWLWREGISPRWAALHEGRRRRRVPLPTYPFERHRYWVEPSHEISPIGANRPAANGVRVIAEDTRR